MKMHGKKNVHIALDLDKTLAYHESRWGISKIGEPIQPIVEKLREWLAKGYKVSIFTARVNKVEHTQEEYDRAIDEIITWLKKHNLPILEITALKSRYFTHIIDDRAYHVVRNLGKISDELDI